MTLMEPAFQFEQARDMEIVRQIVTTPAIFSAASDDGCAPREEFRPPSHCAYAIARAKDGLLLGCYGLEPRNSVLIEIHTCLLPAAWGRSVEISTAFLDWLWANSNCMRITTRVPTFNRLALRLAKSCGMLEFGRDVKSFQKRGMLHDEILLGISRPRVM
jgi:RimJ/RimL family protein N-acetyltransferase